MQIKQQQFEHNMEQLDGFKLKKEYNKAIYILSPCLFNLCAENTMWNTRLDASQAGIKIAGRNNNLRYADDNTVRAENEEELKNLLMRVKEDSEEPGLKLNIKKKNKN